MRIVALRHNLSTGINLWTITTYYSVRNGFEDLLLNYWSPYWCSVRWIHWPFAIFKCCWYFSPNRVWLFPTLIDHWVYYTYIAIFRFWWHFRNLYVEFDHIRHWLNVHALATGNVSHTIAYCSIFGYIFKAFESGLSIWDIDWRLIDHWTCFYCNNLYTYSNNIIANYML